MTGVWLDIREERRSRRECHAHGFRNIAEVCALDLAVAVASAKRYVVLSVDNKHGAGEGR